MHEERQQTFISCWTENPSTCTSLCGHCACSFLPTCTRYHRLRGMTPSISDFTHLIFIFTTPMLLMLLIRDQFPNLWPFVTKTVFNLQT